MHEAHNTVVLADIQFLVVRGIVIEGCSLNYTSGWMAVLDQLPLFEQGWPERKLACENRDLCHENENASVWRRRSVQITPLPDGVWSLENSHIVLKGVLVTVSHRWSQIKKRHGRILINSETSMHTIHTHTQQVSVLTRRGRKETLVGRACLPKMRICT